jgi:hypothetical protein
LGGGESVIDQARHLVAIAAACCAVACQSYTDATPRRVLDSDPSANYERVFDHPVPKDVEIVHSVVIAYSWRLGVVTTDDWAFEVVAPRSWIDEQIEELDLVSADSSWGFEDLLQRKQSGLPEWYAPLPIDSYQRYVLLLTSIPYVHMLVSKTPEPDSRYRVFTRKR